jgi:TPR repeat protein
MGNRLLYGLDIPKSPTEAFSWYLKAANQGIAEAQHKLGELYYEGKGVPQNYKQAASWYFKSAEQKDLSAIRALANCYAMGEGVPQDYKQAYAWASLGAAIDTYGFGSFTERRDEYATKLPPAKLAEAQELAGKYYEKYHPK